MVWVLSLPQNVFVKVLVGYVRTGFNVNGVNYSGTNYSLSQVALARIKIYLKNNQ